MSLGTVSDKPDCLSPPKFVVLAWLPDFAWRVALCVILATSFTQSFLPRKATDLRLPFLLIAGIGIRVVFSSLCSILLSIVCAQLLGFSAIPRRIVPAMGCTASPAVGFGMGCWTQRPVVVLSLWFWLLVIARVPHFGVPVAGFTTRVGRSAPHIISASSCTCFKQLIGALPSASEATQRASDVAEFPL